MPEQAVEELNMANLQVGFGVAQEDDAWQAGNAAGRQARRGLAPENLAAVLVFASVRYDLPALLKGVQAVFDQVPVLGASTAGEIVNAPRQGSVVVIALASPYLQVRLGLGQGVSRDWRGAVLQAVNAPEVAPFFSLRDVSAWSELTRHGKSAFALLFSPGNTRAADSLSYEILEELKNLSQGRLPILGGGSADDWRMEGNYVFLGQQAYSDSMLIAVFETRLRFGIGVAHGYRPLLQRATVTKARDHEVLELDGRPAAEVYCDLNKLPRQRLEGAHLTLATGRPVGLLYAYGQYSLAVASYFTPENGIRFSQPVAEGTVLTMMAAGLEDLINAGQEAMRKAMLRGDIRDPAMALVFSCALRRRFLGERIGGEIQGIQSILPGVPVLGFYSFGEQALADDGVNRHHNDVIAVLVLDQELSHGAQVALENERLRRELEGQSFALISSNLQLQQEIAERQLAEKALRQNEQFLANIFDSIQDGISILDTDYRILRVNPTIEEWFAPSMPLMGKKCYEAYWGRQDPCEFCPSRQALENGRSTVAVVPASFGTGERRCVEQYTFPLVDEDSGQVKGTIAYIRDITAQRLAQEALHQKEEQLRQMQKLEAIGRLAGGVAHDFNNLLTGIMGYADLLLLRLAPGDPLYHHVKEIAHTADRAATLIGQLLAFGRRQLLQPQALNLNLLINNLHHLLRHTIRENVELATSLAPGLGTVRADIGQMEQVLLNLAINAGDSMPQGGTLTISTANLDLDDDFASRHPEIAPGPYVTLSVSDTGAGMDQETLSQIFEPFFTTKELGRGTGLGLATVYGIIRQSGGNILCASQPGQGTTFTVYLPRINETQEQASPVRQPLEAARGSETILLVEDNEVVRQVTTQVLRSRGYTVLEAAGGQEALALSEQYPGPIHLLLTDVIMPGMNGLEVAERWMARRPATRVLFMSGYPEDLMGRPDQLWEKVFFLQKPFTPELLARKVREALDE